MSNVIETAIDAPTPPRPAELAEMKTIKELIDSAPLSAVQIWTFVLCGLVATFDGFDTQSMGFIAPAIADSLNIDLNSFGPIFASGLVGVMFGSLLTGPIADRFGRKWPLIASAMLFAAFSALTAQAHTFDVLLVCRFLTGLGLGGAMPNVVAISSEFAPKRIESTVVAGLFCGMPLGALLAGMVASVLIPIWGWRAIFYVGGLIPFCISLLLIAKLPESVQFLAVSRAAPEKIAAILRRIGCDRRYADTWATREEVRNGIAVKYLFTEGRAVHTILLWIPYFMNLLILYFIMSWLPAILRESGMPFSAGVLTISLFSLGGLVGSAAQGVVMDRYGTFAILLIEFLATTVFIVMIAFMPLSYAVIVPISFVMGWCVQAAQSGLNVLAAEFYPTSIHSTGIGWALGVGRIGSIAGPLLGGVMLTLHWNAHQIFLAGMLPALCCVMALSASCMLPAKGS